MRAHINAICRCRCGLDVFEDEPQTKPGLKECENAVIVPHIASASFWTRAGMVGNSSVMLNSIFKIAFLNLILAPEGNKQTDFNYFLY